MGFDIGAIRKETLKKCTVRDALFKEMSYVCAAVVETGKCFTQCGEQTAFVFVQIFDRVCPNLQESKNFKMNLCFEILEYDQFEAKADAASSRIKDFLEDELVY